MRTHSPTVLLAFLGVLFICACAEPRSAPTAPGGIGLQSAVAGQVIVCHLPPGNSGNARTIAVSANAVPAHLAHGDDVGACEGHGLFGMWRAVSLMGNGVEYLHEGLSAVFTLRSDGTYLESISGDANSLFCQNTETSCEQEYTYHYTSDTVVFCDPGCDEWGDFVVTGNKMTFRLYDPDDGVAWTMTFKRMS